ncbi:MAG TPA: GNAT family N-acetyltransferase [Actinomycetota bacterium]|nr:GNAT family N-acetyltransferase [Actinomycetota bacterium]
MPSSVAMQIRLGGIEPRDARRFLEVTEAAFGAGLPDDVFEDIRHTFETDRALAAFDGRSMVGTTAAYSLRLTVPGGEVDCAGVTMDGVVPSLRRRGVMKALMTRQLRDVAERGEPLAALWASEDPIYGRFGYGAATVQALIDVPRHRAAFLDDSPVDGTLRLVDKDEAVRVFPAVYDRVRAETPGMFRRSDLWWRHRVLRDQTRDEEGGPFFRALLEQDGEPAAYAVYKVHQRWDRGVSRGNVELREVIAATPRATRAVWKFVFGIDLVESVRSTAFFLPYDHPLQLMLAEPRYLGFLLSNGLWVRVVDVAEALAARSYAGDGSISLEIGDPLLDRNSGTWRLDVDGGRASVSKTSGDGDVTLGIGELGALYLGQFTFSQMLAAGRVSGTREAVARADDLWRTRVAPWCPEIF